MGHSVAHIPEWTLGERLAKARSDVGLTQEEMAVELGVSPSAVAKWEADRGQPRDFMARIKQWSEITGAPEAWLLDVMSSMPSYLPLSLVEPAIGQLDLPFEEALDRFVWGHDLALAR